MRNICMPLTVALIGAAISHAHAADHAPPKMALDMNVECVSLLGENLYRTPAEGAELKVLEGQLAEAQKNADAQPENPAVHLARGQALAALWRYHDAAQAYTKAIALAPQSAGEAYSRRANSFLVLRLFDLAKIDYEQSVAVAPETATSWLGLGITNYLRQQFEAADRAFTKALELPLSDEERPVAGFWKELTNRRLGKPANTAAPTWPFMSEFSAAADKLVARDEAGALQAFRDIVASNEWPVLPRIAAESEIAAIEGSKKMRSAR